MTAFQSGTAKSLELAAVEGEQIVTGNLTDGAPPHRTLSPDRLTEIPGGISCFCGCRGADCPCRKKPRPLLTSRLYRWGEKAAGKAAAFSVEFYRQGPHGTTRATLALTHVSSRCSSRDLPRQSKTASTRCQRQMRLLCVAWEGSEGHDCFAPPIFLLHLFLASQT